MTAMMSLLVGVACTQVGNGGAYMIESGPLPSGAGQDFNLEAGAGRDGRLGGVISIGTSVAKEVVVGLPTGKTVIQGELCVGGTEAENCFSASDFVVLKWGGLPLVYQRRMDEHLQEDQSTFKHAALYFSVLLIVMFLFGSWSGFAMGRKIESYRYERDMPRRNVT